jgi:uncharacterized protein GlcG (DUF336 family)
MPLSLKRLAQCAAGACLLASLPQAASAQAVIMERQLSFDAARAMATAALETCRKNGYRVSVTVVDNAGDVRAAYRDDGTPPHTYDASFRKAYTARTYRISTIEFAKRIATESDRPGHAMIKDALGLPGGLPIHGPLYCSQARTPSVIRSWKLDGPTIASIPASRISSRTTSRTRAKARVIPRLRSSLIRLNSSSPAVMSMKLTGPKSRSTRLTSGRAASDAFNASLTWPTLAKKRSPPIRKINNPGKVIASG